MTQTDNDALVCELLPCPNPWCGSHCRRDSEIFELHKPLPMEHADAPGRWTIACPVCPMAGPPCDTEEQAIAAWNARSTTQPKPLDPPAQDEVERVTSIIEGSLERHGVALRHCEGTRDDAIAAIAALDQHRGADAQVSSMCFAMEMAALRRNHSDEADALREENVRLREALRTAIGHIEHMAAWITKQGAGYSFESLGEDMPDMRAALAGRQG